MEASKKVPVKMTVPFASRARRTWRVGHFSRVTSKVGCKSWKHLDPEVNNVDVDKMSDEDMQNGEMSDSNSESEKSRYS